MGCTVDHFVSVILTNQILSSGAKLTEKGRSLRIEDGALNVHMLGNTVLNGLEDEEKAPIYTYMYKRPDQLSAITIID